MIKTNARKLRQIYLAGGCFWGTEKYFSQIGGVIQTEVGYANGNTANPTYEDVCCRNSGHAETVKVVYDANQISLPFLLSLFYDSIDPTALNRQGGDRGTQYRTGIYYVEPADEAVIRLSIAELQKKHKKPILIEVLPLKNYDKAEAYHQNYLHKQPNGYCHIGREQFEKAKLARDNSLYYQPAEKDALKKKLTPIQYEVTQNAATEPPFANAYYHNQAQGIYVDVTSGEPLFASTHQFDAGCGWPSFTKPLSEELIRELQDNSLGMKRVEVRSQNSNAHLGHVFSDGPIETGGLRYCINSAALLFIPIEEMEKAGYGYLLPYLKKAERE